MNETQTRDIQLQELEILKEVKRICDLHKIRYYLSSGTLLGAVRHKGFIPWDDDIDIMMPPDDYIRFLEVATSELGEEFFLQTYETDPYFYASFAKIRKNGTAMMRWNDERYHIHHGIWLDIFPIIYVKSDSDYRIKKKILKLTNCLQMDDFLKASKDDFEKEYSKLTICMLKMLHLLPQGLRSKMHKWILSYFFSVKSGEKTTFIWNTLDKIYPSDLYAGPVREISFEDESFGVPSQTEGWLTACYGDYMTLPPVEERRTHTLLIYNSNRSYEFYMQDESQCGQ